jgi:hypothetical protein
MVYCLKPAVEPWFAWFSVVRWRGMGVGCAFTPADCRKSVLAPLVDAKAVGRAPPVAMIHAGGGSWWPDGWCAGPSLRRGRAYQGRSYPSRRRPYLGDEWRPTAAAISRSGKNGGVPARQAISICGFLGGCENIDVGIWQNGQRRFRCKKADCMESYVEGIHTPMRGKPN